jgi:hypothetical protein
MDYRTRQRNQAPMRGWLSRNCWICTEYCLVLQRHLSANLRYVGLSHFKSNIMVSLAVYS